MEPRIKNYKYKLIYDDYKIHIIHRGSNKGAHDKLKVLLYEIDKIVLPDNSFMFRSCVVDFL